MNQQPPSDALTRPFLVHLCAEEQLLRTALEITLELYEALRKGDLNGLKTVQPRQEELAAALTDAANRRERAAAQLGKALGFSKQGVTLKELAEALDPALATPLLEARARLTSVANQLAEYQGRNANLIHYLRSYFRSVLATLSGTGDVPVRYGRTGTRLDTTFVAAHRARV